MQKNMTNLKQYFEYEKNNLDINEGDFLRILNNIDTRKSNYGHVINKTKVKSEYFAWAFGFAGLSIAAFMFMIKTNIETPIVAIISKQEIETLRAKSQKTVEVINSINSFEGNTN